MAGAAPGPVAAGFDAAADTSILGHTRPEPGMRPITVQRVPTVRPRPCQHDERPSRPDRRHRGRLLAVLALLAFVAGAAPDARAAVEPATGPRAVEEAGAPLARMTVLGASVSAGFGLPPDPTGWRPDLATFLDAALDGRHDPVESVASDFLFLDPPHALKEQASVSARQLQTEAYKQAETGMKKSKR